MDIKCLQCYFDCKSFSCDDFLDGEEALELLCNDDITDVWYEMSYRQYIDRWTRETE